MRNGFIKAGAGTPKIHVADCRYNGEQILALMKQASEQSVKLLVLPELCITGYTCGDLFLQRKLLDAAAETLVMLVQESKGLQMLTVVGLPVIHKGKLYNCAAVIYDGELLGIIPKSSLPNYSEFYEKRHFEPAPFENDMIRIGNKFEVAFGIKLLFQCRNLPEFCMAVEICEDLWVPQPPSVNHALAGAAIIVNPSASDETIGKADYRRQLVAGQSAKLICAYLYADAGDGESTTDMVFAGHNLIAENGIVLAEGKSFADELLITEVDVGRLEGERRRMTTFPPSDRDGYQTISFDMEIQDTLLTRPVPIHPFIPSNLDDRAKRCEEILTMQAAGLRKRLEHSHSKTAVVGISGGLDSCLALLVSVRAMDQLKRPRTDVIAITMPCFGTTARTKSNAELLSERLGVTLKCVDIKEAVEVQFRDLGHATDNFNVVYENVQARTRTEVLMNTANQTSGLVVGTGDLSELALGWATYNGDHMSMYGVNASVPKTLIRHIVRYYADTSGDIQLREVLLDILDTPVSPELLPADAQGEIAQKTEDLVGPYELHDFFLYYIVRWAFPPKKVFYLAEYAFKGVYGRETILKWLRTFYRRFFNQQFKRSCLPDGPKVGSVTLSPRGDWRMPSDACSTIWLEELENL